MPEGYIASLHRHERCPACGRLVLHHLADEAATCALVLLLRREPSPEV